MSCNRLLLFTRKDGRLKKAEKKVKKERAGGKRRSRKESCNFCNGKSLELRKKGRYG